MADWFVPEADALDQQRDVAPAQAVPDDEEEPQAPEPALEYPEQLPVEAPEADLVEQAQTVETDDESGG